MQGPDMELSRTRTYRLIQLLHFSTLLVLVRRLPVLSEAASLLSATQPNLKMRIAPVIPTSLEHARDFRTTAREASMTPSWSLMPYNLGSVE